MKLISCHIENFGKISNTDLNFTDGLNVICQENGWGKSTLAAFIKAMFYGFSGEAKRSIKENERKRFYPWQGGVYGGNIDFEAGEKKYRLTRVFRDKEIQDEFELRDLNTNLISQDFSVKIGEELFGINSESFIRTVFIGQNESVTSSTDDINSKVGKLVDDSDDLSNYENALKILTERMNALTPRRATGSLYKRKDEIARYERLIRDSENVRDSLHTQGKQLEAERAELEKLLKAQNENNELLKKLSEEKAVKATHEEWIRLKEAYGTKRETVENTVKFFKNGIPSISDIETELTKSNLLKSKEAEMSAFMLSKDQKDELSALEKEFENGAVESETIKNAVNLLSSFEKGADKNTPEAFDSDVFRSLPQISSEVGKITSDIKLYTREKENLESLKKDISGLEASLSKEKSTDKGSNILMISGILLLITCVILFFFGINSDAGFLCICGAASGVSGIILLLAGLIKKNRDNTAFKEKETELANKNQAASESEKQLMRLDMSVQTSSSKLIKDLHILDGKRERYSQLSAQEQNYDRAVENYTETRKEIEVFLKKYGFEIEEKIDVQLLKIRDLADDHFDALKALKEAENTLSDFEKQKSDILSKENASETISYEEAQKEASDIVKNIDRIKKNISDYEGRLEFLREKLDEYEENTDTLSELKSIQEEEKNRFKITSLAKDALVKAKENMTSRYVKPLLENFRKYYSIITGKDTNGIHMDANIKITIDEAGMQRDSELFSAGYRDLFGTALRVSLADAMYPEETPFLIMDDPFVNLDDDKLSKVDDFLKMLKQKYQIIYFTCSGSRKINV